MTGLKDFSTDPASNDVAAPPILWIEGQPAGTVNNSARAMMAALACWHRDMTGLAGATGGALGAYTLGTQQGFTAADYANAFDLAWTPDAANPGPCTFQPDAAGFKPLRRPGGTELAPGDIQVGQVYRTRWHPGTGQVTVVSPFIEAAGTIKAFASAGSVPPGWVPCDGSALSRVSYAALFAAIGGTWGSSDAATFNVPDFRGRTLFGVDAGTGRLTGGGGLGGVVGNTGGVEAVALSVAQLASHGHGGSTAGAGGHDHGGSVAAAGQHAHGGVTGGSGGHNHTGTTAAGGDHSHTGATDVGGGHVHPIKYNRGAAAAGQNTVVTSIYSGESTNSGGQTDDNATSSGAHSHNLAIQGVGGHQHGFTTSAVADHAHGISADGQHAHTIPAVGDHAHALSIDAAGSGQAHPNMPPGAVVVWAIKA